MDNDDWCDLWCNLYPSPAGEKHSSKETDSDGDGLTDYEEMILMRNPFVMGEMPRHLTRAEIAANKKNKRKHVDPRTLEPDFAAKLARGFMTFEKAKANKDSYRPNTKKRTVRNKTFAAQLKKISGKNEQLLKQHQRNLHPAHKASGICVQSICPKGHPRLMQFDSVAAAHDLNVIDLWPGGSSPLKDVEGVEIPADTETGTRDIGIEVGLWDSGRLFPHRYFEDRENNIPFRRYTAGDSNQNLEQHATNVAGIINASRIDFNGNPLTNNFDDVRGMAPKARIRYHHIDNHYEEMIAAAADGMNFSNHSYSPPAGWGGLPAFLGIPFEWRWFGPPELHEDPEFGAYTYWSKEIDSHAYLSKTHLTVWSSSNEAAELGPISEVQGTIAQGNGVIDPTDTGDPNDPLITGTYYYAINTQTDFTQPPVWVRSFVPHPSDGGIPQPGASVFPYFEGALDEGPLLGLGLSTIKSTASAKNNLSVGCIVGGGDPEFFEPSELDTQIQTISSRGPTDDGRVKPDLVAPGFEMRTTNFNFEPDGSISDYDAATSPQTGTSLSTPCVTGTLALLEEAKRVFTDRKYLASTWKALLLSTATDLTKIPDYLGTQAASANLVGPDYFYGWGLCNALAATELLTKNLESGSQGAHMREHILYEGNTIQSKIIYDGQSPEMKVMICWTDVPYQTSTISSLSDDVLDPDYVDPALADPNSVDRNDTTPKLMNDLDLRITAPNGEVLMPWVLDRTTPLTAAVPGDNILDNVEQIVIPNPIPGTYTVTISHKGNLKASVPVMPGEPEYDANEALFRLLPSGQHQDVSLVVVGNLDPSPILPRLSTPILVDEFTVMMEVEAALGLRYVVEVSDDLETWRPPVGNTANPFTVEQSPHAIASILDGSASTKKFYRVREVSPLD